MGIWWGYYRTFWDLIMNIRDHFSLVRRELRNNVLYPYSLFKWGTTELLRVSQAHDSYGLRGILWDILLEFLDIFYRESQKAHGLPTGCLIVIGIFWLHDHVKRDHWDQVTATCGVKIRVLRGFSMVWMPHPRRRWKVVPSAWRTWLWLRRPWGCHVATAIIPDVLRIGSWESCDAPCAMLQWNEWSVTTQIFFGAKRQLLVTFWVRWIFKYSSSPFLNWGRRTACRSRWTLNEDRSSQRRSKQGRRNGDLGRLGNGESLVPVFVGNALETLGPLFRSGPVW